MIHVLSGSSKCLNAYVLPQQAHEQLECACVTRQPGLQRTHTS